MHYINVRETDYRRGQEAEELLSRQAAAESIRDPVRRVYALSLCRIDRMLWYAKYKERGRALPGP